MSVAAIILAAGLSRRFGASDKLLAEIDGEPIIRRVTRIALNSRCACVHVVIRPGAQEIEAALQGLPVVHCTNPNFADGIGSSIATGVRSLPPDVSGALILPADMPWLDWSLLDRLIGAFDASGMAKVTYPVSRAGKQRNPVIWPRAFFAQLSELDADKGGKELIPRSPDHRIEVETAHEFVFRDIDRPEDLLR